MSQAYENILLMAHYHSMVMTIYVPNFHLYVYQTTFSRENVFSVVNICNVQLIPSVYAWLANSAILF